MHRKRSKRHKRHRNDYDNSRSSSQKSIRSRKRHDRRSDYNSHPMHSDLNASQCMAPDDDGAISLIKDTEPKDLKTLILETMRLMYDYGYNMFRDSLSNIRAQLTYQKYLQETGEIDSIRLQNTSSVTNHDSLQARNNDLQLKTLIVFLLAFLIILLLLK